MIELTCWREYYEDGELQAEIAPDRFQGTFDDYAEAMGFMVDRCAEGDQNVCYVYNVEEVDG